MLAREASVSSIGVAGHANAIHRLHSGDLKETAAKPSDSAHWGESAVRLTLIEI
jgi:hypothetical protein